ncbi:alpha-ketoacid dehydrogenase subunit beta [Bordetella petrii]|nr:alpha-ketoacid dehydrogenase subunit beta [Bordetella petrii]
MASKNYCWAIIDGIREEMARDDGVFLIGEDVGAAGGAFGGSRGLFDAFGQLRVRDTPISEEIIVGLGVGAAMAGKRPIVEVMFMDFFGLCLDQIANQAAKVQYLYAGMYRMPLVVRTLVAAEMGIGPHHSQSLEAWVGHVPGLKVLMPSTPRDAKGLLKAAVRDDNPVIFIEHLGLHRMREDVPDGDDAIVPIGVADIKRPGRDVTVIATGLMVAKAVQAAEALARDGIEIEVIDPRTIAPLDIETIVASVKRTNRALVVTSAHKHFGFGAEVASEIMAHAFYHLDAPVRCLTPPFTPQPFGKGFEAYLHPNADRIAATVREMVA